MNSNVSIQERALIIENIKKFLIEHLPSDQVTSPQKAHELAVRFENHVASSTETKEQYHGMIGEKLRLIKLKSNEPSPSLSAKSLQSVQSVQSTNSTQTVKTQTSIQSNQSQLSSTEISQITARLLQIRPQVPQIDKLISLHSKLPIPPPNTSEMIKKLSDCRNVLVNQMEMSTGIKKSFFMNLGQLNLLIEQVQRLFNSLVTKMKESAGVNNVNANSPISSLNSAQITSTNTNNNNLKLSPSLPSQALNSSSSNSSISKTSVKHQIYNSISTKSSNLLSSTNLSHKSFEKLLSQRLAMPSDDFGIFNSLNEDYNWMLRFILNISKTSTTSNTNNIISNSRKRKYIHQRDLLLKNELKYLKNQGYRINLQETGFGTLSILIFSFTLQVRFFFQISPIYPYDQLIYRIQTPNLSNSLLPKHLEPKTFPLTVTNILENYKRSLHVLEKNK